jgi:DNA repair exonuclease SbcCD ATPase subunit
MTGMDVKTQNFSFEAVEEKDGKFFVIGKALSKDFECEAGLKSLANDIIKAPFVWRHRHPIEEKHNENHIYGRVQEAWVTDYLMVKAEIYGHTQDHLALRELIKERAKVKNPLSFSMHYRTYFNEDKSKKIHWDVYELSGTPFPACKTCQIENFIGEQQMPENEKKELEQLETTVKKIKDLEDNLNAKTKSLEILQTEVKKLEAETKSKDQELEDKKKATKSLEDRVLELENYSKYLEQKKPVIDEILKLESLDSRQVDWFRTQDVEYLNKKLEEFKKKAETKIHTQDLDKSSSVAKAKGAELDKKLEEKDEPTFDIFTSQLGKKKQGA